MADEVLRLCQECSEKARARFDATAKHNPDASVEFWERWYGPETERQLKAIREHCYAT